MKRTKPPKQSRPSGHKGRMITADYLPFEIAMQKSKELLFGDRPQIGFLILLGINTGLRLSDLLKSTHEHMAGRFEGDRISITERKTNKRRDMTINRHVVQAYTMLRAELSRRGKSVTGPIFISQKGTVFSNNQVNLILKKEFAGHALNISSHSLRKTFGRHVYEINEHNEDALVKLSEMFNHANVQITRRYLGLRQEEIRNIYLNL